MQKLAEICIRRPVFATMLIMALVVMGLAAYSKLGVDRFPKIDFPIVTHHDDTPRRRAGGDRDAGLASVSKKPLTPSAASMTSGRHSSEGISIVSIQFMLDKDPDVAAQEVRDKINTVVAQLPKDADPPVVEKLATDASPILDIAVSVHSRSARDHQDG